MSQILLRVNNWSSALRALPSSIPIHTLPTRFSILQIFDANFCPPTLPSSPQTFCAIFRLRHCSALTLILVLFYFILCSTSQLRASRSQATTCGGDIDMYKDKGEIEHRESIQTYSRYVESMYMGGGWGDRCICQHIVYMQKACIQEEGGEAAVNAAAGGGGKKDSYVLRCIQRLH